MAKIAAVQMTSTANVAENLQQAAQLIDEATQKEAKLIVLPEMFPMMGETPKEKLSIKEVQGNGRIQDFLAKKAAEKKVWIVGGTMPIASDSEPNKVYAAALVFNEFGERVARYDKIHLFDATVAESEIYEESATTLPGKQLILVETPVGKMGLAVCYDVRFPELFRELFRQGAELFAIPAAFTVPTGRAHWEVLTRSRAIENLSYVIGACQTGSHPNHRKTYGHSIIVEPWGAVVAQLSEGIGVITAEIDLEYLRQRRCEIPVESHRRL